LVWPLRSMSLSPPVWRYPQPSTSAAKREEDLINAYEAEEEKIINVLSRKLEKLREEKIELENVLEAESEAQVNRLNREISALRLAAAQNGTNGANGVNGAGNNNAPTTALADDLAEFRTFRRASLAGLSPGPSTEIVLEALRRENEQLRSRVADMERDYVKLMRLNEIYREELIDHRRRMGMSVDNLIGISNVEPVSHPRRRRSISNATSVSPTVGILSTQLPRPMYSVPIPRLSSQIHRPTMDQLSEGSTSCSESPFPLSPVPASFASVNTQMTSPLSSSLNSNPAIGTPRLSLTYPTNPPPSLSSSFGSPSAYASPRREQSSSPVHSFGRPDVVNRRPSFDRRFGDSSSTLTRGRSGSRKESVERGARVAETGTLIRSRGDSLSGPGPSTFKSNEIPFAS